MSSQPRVGVGVGVGHRHININGHGNGNGNGLPRRRNGKEQACEPCRKAKIACDHSLPICSRCKRRKLAQRCVYLSAPMTRPSASGSESASVSASASVSDATAAARRQSEPVASIRAGTGSYPLTPNTGSTVVSPANHGAVTATSSPIYQRASIPRPVNGTTAPTKPGGFFGPTSFNAVFAENKENLGGTDDIPIMNDLQPSFQSSESLQAQMYLMLAGKKDLEIGDPRVFLGARVLCALPDRNTCNFLLEWYFDRSSDTRSYKRTVLAAANSLWSVSEGIMIKAKEAKDLEQLSSMICENSVTPLEETDDFDAWVESISGPNLRWEVVGGIFVGLTSAILSLQERDAFFTKQRGPRSDRKHFAVEMKDCIQACITLSNHMELLNILMVQLLSRNFTLQTIISGDTSLVCWRQLGDLVSATTALGLHRQQTNQPITFLSEFKKFLFAVVFGIEKGASLLTGRPPALSYRYTRFELPLDLDDDLIIKGGPELQSAIERLDPQGWNTDSVNFTSAKCRAHGLLAIVLNEVLELSLGETCASSESINYLLDRLEKTYNSFPSYLRLDTTDPSFISATDALLWLRLCTRLHMLEHRLILERLAHKNGYRDGQTMIDCAREMLELTVLMWVQRDRFIDHHCDYDWILMCWGVPSSGVLCVELLKQTKQAAETPETPSTLRLPRSEIVQNLSLLIGFLEWVRPAAGNYQLCRRMSLLVKRILDQILNPSPPSSIPNPAASSQETIQTDGPPGFDTASAAGGGIPIFDPAFDIGNWEDGLDNLDWLNAVDWSRGPWRLDLVGGQDFTAAARWN